MQPTFSVDVPSAGTVEKDLDLSAPSPFRLHGRIAIDGKPPRFVAPDFTGYGEPVPRIVLDRGNRYDYTSRCDPDVEGRFQLGASRSGAYRLRANLELEGGTNWIVLDRVELMASEASWTLEVPTGSVRVSAIYEKGRRTPFVGMVRWEGPDHQRVFACRGMRNEKTDEVIFPKVPLGRVQLVVDKPGERTILADFVAEPGETFVPFEGK